MSIYWSGWICLDIGLRHGTCDTPCTVLARDQRATESLGPNKSDVNVNPPAPGFGGQLERRGICVQSHLLIVTFLISLQRSQPVWPADYWSCVPPHGMVSDLPARDCGLTSSRRWYLAATKIHGQSTKMMFEPASFNGKGNLT